MKVRPVVRLLILPLLPAMIAGCGSSSNNASTAAPDASNTVAAKPADNTATTKPVIDKSVGAGTIEKITEAGLQVEVPKDWKLEHQPGKVATAYAMVSPDGAQFVLIPVENTNMAGRLAGMRDAMKAKAKSLHAGPEQESAINGMTYLSRRDTAESRISGPNVMETGYFKTKKPVIIVMGGPKKAFDANSATLAHILQSVKKTT